MARHPHGERIAALETALPALAGEVRASFKDMKHSFDALNETVKNLVTAEQTRVGIELERKRQQGRRTFMLTTGSGIVGSALTAMGEWFMHGGHQ